MYNVFENICLSNNNLKINKANFYTVTNNVFLNYEYNFFSTYFFRMSFRLVNRGACLLCHKCYGKLFTSKNDSSDKVIFVKNVRK